MPWRETQKMEERMGFISDWRRLVKSDPQQLSMAELCRNYGVSRKSGYALVGRYEEKGVAAFSDGSHAPHSNPHAVTGWRAWAIVEVRREHPTWGPKKIRAWLNRKRPGQVWPVESTIGELLDRHGLVKRRQRKRHVAPCQYGLTAALAPNDVWGVDFKGWFRTGDGSRCDPFSLSDLMSRYVLRLQAVARTDTEHVWPIFDAAFREFGTPKIMRSDNGAPFASGGVAGLSRLAVRLIKAGVLPERIEPGKPQQNGRHERLHLTVKTDTASPPAATVRAQQQRFDSFRRIFNEERPHEALGQTSPAEHYRPSGRSYRGRLTEPEYPLDQEVRRVRTTGEIKWKGNLVFIGEALIGEPVGIDETEDGLFLVAYGPVQLGWLDREANFTARRAGVDPSTAPQPQPPG